MKKVRNKTRTKEYPQGKPSVDFSVSWLKQQVERMEKEYDILARNYSSLVVDGYGLKNIHVLDMLRQLQFLYTTIAAHKAALLSLKVEFW